MRGNSKATDVVIIGLLGLVLVACLSTWLGAWTATTATGGTFNAPLIDGLHAAHAYLTRPDQTPAAVWGQPDVPSPTVVYPITIGWAVAIGASIIAAVRTWRTPRSGYVTRRRLGASPEARFARTRELATLRYRRPVPGRFILGRAGRWTLASVGPRYCDDGLTRLDRTRRWLFARHRAQAFGAVAIIGLSQTGKSQHALTALRALSAAGCPMICSSVKGDIIDHLLAQRRHTGKVGVFDPTGKLQTTYEHRRTLGLTVPPGWDQRLCIGWSPLDGIETYDHAVAAAHRLAEAGPDMDKVTAGDFWKTQAEILLGPLLWIAARTGRDMGDVTMWVLAEDRPDPDNDTAPTPEPLQLLEPLIHSPHPAVRRDAQRAEQILYGLWNKAATTVGSVYATSNTLLAPWATDHGRHSSTGQLANLDWLLSGPGHNTLFISAPPQEQRQLRPVLTSTISSILDATYRHVDLHGPLDPPLVVFLDEIGNAPLARLPEYLSTLAAAGVLLITVWQDISQIRKTYGDHAGSILSNSRHVLIFGGTKDTATIDWARQILGDEGAPTLSTTNDIGALTSGSVSTSEQRVALTPANVLREMPTHKTLLISANNLPAEIHHLPEHNIHAFTPLPTWPHPPDTTIGLPTHNHPTHHAPTSSTGQRARVPFDAARHLAATFDSPIAKAIARLDLLAAIWQRRRTSSGGSTSGQTATSIRHTNQSRQPDTNATATDCDRPGSDHQPRADDVELDRITNRLRRTWLARPTTTPPRQPVDVDESTGVENLV